MRVVPVLALLASVLLLAGCPKKPTTVPEGEAGTGVPAQTDETMTGAGQGGDIGQARPLPGAEGMGGPSDGGVAGGNIIYFDFDRSDIKPEYADLIAAHARKLASAPALKVRLEGHTDERGSREYNIALGERRAQAVRRALMLGGASDAQLVTVSYGEERPALDGDTEEAYAENRRVVIVYGN